MKACIVTIGYRNYLVPSGTVSHLLEVANECVPVTWENGAYEYDPKGEGFIDSMSLSPIRQDDGSSDAAEPVAEPVVPATHPSLLKPLSDDDIQF
jgi:hypothetical protein